MASSRAVTGLRRLRVSRPAALVAKPEMTLGETAKLTFLQQASIRKMNAMGVLERILGKLGEASASADGAV
ncbi:hypothetical protein GFM44_30965 [Rhizobium leguminosarum bv. viciae]|nr:hypothetical protein [Rhizobium leguminosarum bv. viciae]